MQNEFNVSNLNEIHKSDFDTMVALNGLEVFNHAAVNAFFNQFGNILEKGEENELTSEDKSNMALIKAEINSLKRHVVINDKFEKSIAYTRPIQVDIEKGIYLDTDLNRKLNRVGKTFKKTE